MVARQVLLRCYPLRKLIIKNIHPKEGIIFDVKNEVDKILFTLFRNKIK